MDQISSECFWLSYEWRSKCILSKWQFYLLCHVFFFYINDEPCLLGNYCNLTVAQSCTILILNAQNSTLITSRHLHLFLSGWEPEGKRVLPVPGARYEHGRCEWSLSAQCSSGVQGMDDHCGRYERQYDNRKETITWLPANGQRINWQLLIINYIFKQKYRTLPGSSFSIVRLIISHVLYDNKLNILELWTDNHLGL